MDETPTLPQLMMFGKYQVNIIQEIGSQYHRIGVVLLEDVTGSKMYSIEMGKRHNVEAINLAVLRRWMKGEGRKPTNWATLVTVLNECGLAALADEICSTIAKLGITTCTCTYPNYM